jgi:hypothetical protein
MLARQSVYILCKWYFLTKFTAHRARAAISSQARGQMQDALTI